jgi:hypothetical protein
MNEFDHDTIDFLDEPWDGHEQIAAMPQSTFGPDTQNFLNSSWPEGKS